MSTAAPLHSRLSPSKSAAWSVCTKSVLLIEANADKLPPDGGAHADEGSRAHAAAAALLLDPNATPAFDNPEMAEIVADWVDFVNGLVEPGDELKVELRVPLFYLPSQKGTLDVRIVSKDRRKIRILDLKYGAGVGVYAQSNPQLAIYAESSITEMELIDDIPPDALVTLIIYQPRDRNDPQAHRLWAITRADLAKFCEAITEAAVIITQHPEKATLVAGDHCDKAFCRARGICPAYASRGLEALPVDSAVALVNVDAPQVVPPDPASLTREQRVRVIQARKVLEKWLEAVEDQEVAELLAGAPRVGLKLVEGKSNRQWADEVAAEKLLANYLDIETRRKPWEVISIAQSEKALKKVEKSGVEVSTKFWGKFAALQVKPPGKPTICSEDDPRPAISQSPSEGMTDLTGSDCI